MGGNHPLATKQYQDADLTRGYHHRWRRRAGHSAQCGLNCCEQSWRKTAGWSRSCGRCFTRDRGGVSWNNFSPSWWWNQTRFWYLPSSGPWSQFCLDWMTPTDGQHGIQFVLEIRRKEVKICMGLARCSSIQQINPSFLGRFVRLQTSFARAHLQGIQSPRNVGQFLSLGQFSWWIPGKEIIKPMGSTQHLSLPMRTCRLNSSHVDDERYRGTWRVANRHVRFVFGRPSSLGSWPCRRSWKTDWLTFLLDSTFCRAAHAKCEYGMCLGLVLSRITLQSRWDPYPHGFPMLEIHCHEGFRLVYYLSLLVHPVRLF